MAHVLRGAWRLPPAADDLDAGDLLEASPLLLRSGSAGLAWWRARSAGVPPPVLTPLHDAVGIHALHGAILEAKIGRLVYHLWRTQRAFDGKKFLAS